MRMINEMQPQRFRKKPVIVYAMRLTKDNAKDICDWMNSETDGASPGHYDETGVLFIDTLEGVMRAEIGDWIIQGTEGEFYPCKPAPFETTFEWIPND